MKLLSRNSGFPSLLFPELASPPSPMLRLCACGPCRKTIMTSRIKHDYKITQRCLATKPFFLPLYFWRATRINFFATTSMNVCVALCNYRQVKDLLWRACDALLTSHFLQWRTWTPISLSDDSGEELAAVVAFLRVLVIVRLEIVRSCNLEKSFLSGKPSQVDCLLSYCNLPLPRKVLWRHWYISDAR